MLRELGDNMWSHRHSSCQWSYSTVPYAHKKFSHSETSGKFRHAKFEGYCLVFHRLNIRIIDFVVGFLPPFCETAFKE